MPQIMETKTHLLIVVQFGNPSFDRSRWQIIFDQHSGHRGFFPLQPATRKDLVVTCGVQRLTMVASFAGCDSYFHAVRALGPYLLARKRSKVEGLLCGIPS